MQRYSHRMPSATLILTGFLWVLISSVTAGEKPDTDQKVMRPRAAITFILGDDANAGNPYYRTAENYYRFNDKDRTETVVTSCHSLSEVQAYLMAHIHQQPWDLINLVSHGNQYLGLSVKVAPEGKRASPDVIREGILDGTLGKLPKAVINEETTIVLHGCGLGNNPELIKAVSMAFSNEETSPNVVASRYFEYYSSESDEGQYVKRYLADFWVTSYRMGYHPGNRIIKKRLSAEYPESDVNWDEALSKEQASSAGEVFHYTFDIPVKWVFRYESKEKVPDLESQDQMLQWVSQNPTISQDLLKLNIPPQKFNWWTRPIYVKNEDGSKTPALWVKGYCTMLCVLKLMPGDEDE